MKKTLFIHIGTEKTATTSIQLFCKKNRDVLYGCGLLYPYVISEKNNNAHFSLVASLLRKFDENARVEFANPNIEDFDVEWGFLIRQASENVDKDILISAEHFSSRLKIEHIANISNYLYENLPTHNIKIVINFRAYQELLVSAYSTMLKSGGRKSFNEFFQVIPNKKHYFDYVSIVKNWSSYFGIDNLIVDTFDSELKTNGVIRSFLQGIGIVGLDVNESEYIVNESLSPLTLVYGYKLNEIYHGKEIRKQVLNAFSNNTKGVKGDVLSMEQLSLIDVCFRSDIHELKEMFGKDKIRLKPVAWSKIKNQDCVFHRAEEEMIKVLSGLYS